MFSPNWYHGFLPNDWWPDRNRTFYTFGKNFLPLATSSSQTIELVLSKRHDVIVLGGNVLTLDPTDPANARELLDPRSVVGLFGRIFINLYNPAGNEVYTETWQTGSGLGGVSAAAPDAQVPLENLFRVDQQRGASDYESLWPMPIRVRKGGSLGFKITNTDGINAFNLRLNFQAAILSKDYGSLTKQEMAA